MSIVELELTALTGATVDGGWPQDLEAEENLHTLVRITAEDGLVGVGSCFTSGSLVEGAAELLWPLLKGQSAVEPERVRGAAGRAAEAGGRHVAVVVVLAGGAARNAAGEREGIWW